MTMDLRLRLTSLLIALLGLIWYSGDVIAAPVPVYSVASIAELLATSGSASSAVQVLSFHPGLAKGGGLFSWNAESASAPDNCISFAAAGVGRWIRQIDGALNVTMCGAYWDNIHDDAPVLNHAFVVAAAAHISLTLPGGVGKVCSSVSATQGVILRGQGMGTAGSIGASPTLVDANCMKLGWVFDMITPVGANQFEAPKYYDMSIRNSGNSNPGGCIRWNTVEGGFTDNATSQNYMMHPHAERIYCEMNSGIANQQIGLQCNKCFDGDFSQNNVMFGKYGIALEGSDVMCIGCAGSNRVSGATDNLIRLKNHGTFGNMDRVVHNELLYPSDFGQRYDAFILDGAWSSTIESNHIEGQIKGGMSAIHLEGGFTKAIQNNDIDAVVRSGVAVPHWLVVDGAFVNLAVFNNGCGGCILGAALFNNGHGSTTYFNDGGVRQIITHGGNAANGDAGFPQ
jgi:hypothetical protein